MNIRNPDDWFTLIDLGSRNRDAGEKTEVNKAVDRTDSHLVEKESRLADGNQIVGGEMAVLNLF